MLWQVTRGVSGKVLVKADQFDIIDGALVFFVLGTEGKAVFALARGEWASVVSYDDGEGR